MTRCRIPDLCERYKIDIGIHYLKSKRILSRSVKPRTICLYIQKNHYFVIRKKNRGESLLNGVGEIEPNFKYVKNKINKDNRGQRIRYRFLKHATIDQFENVFVFSLETYNDQESAEAYAAGFNDVNRLQDR